MSKLFIRMRRVLTAALIAIVTVAFGAGLALAKPSEDRGSGKQPQNPPCDAGKAGDHNKHCDDDGDGVPNRSDNCRYTANPDQSNLDGDKKGNACDETPAGRSTSEPTDPPDRDGDGIPNDLDNCPRDWNPDQIDRDGDGRGAACDRNDEPEPPQIPTVPPAPSPPGPPSIPGPPSVPPVPPVPPVPSPPPSGCGSTTDLLDSDSDGVRDGCDDDDDGDGVPDSSDNCPMFWNQSQNDSDGDGAGDSCDPVNDNLLSNLG